MTDNLDFVTGTPRHTLDVAGKCVALYILIAT
jgi:hypothetical protein